MPFKHLKNTKLCYVDFLADITVQENIKQIPKGKFSLAFAKAVPFDTAQLTNALSSIAHCLDDSGIFIGQIGENYDFKNVLNNSEFPSFILLHEKNGLVLFVSSKKKDFSRRNFERIMYTKSW